MTNTSTHSALFYYRGDTLVRRAVAVTPSEDLDAALESSFSHVWEEAAEQSYVGVPVTLEETDSSLTLRFHSPIGEVSVVGLAVIMQDE